MYVMVERDRGIRDKWKANYYINGTRRTLNISLQGTKVFPFSTAENKLILSSFKNIDYLEDLEGQNVEFTRKKSLPNSRRVAQ